ncbi:MAG: hypothetical protein ACYCYO_00355 [Bacilli bacterium]
MSTPLTQGDRVTFLQEFTIDGRRHPVLQDSEWVVWIPAEGPLHHRLLHLDKWGRPSPPNTKNVLMISQDTLDAMERDGLVVFGHYAMIETPDP